VVQALQALRGVQWLVAMTVVAELGDRTRFDSPRQLAAFVGLMPSEYSSGPARRQGGITKAGNGRARRALIEAAWAYRHPAKASQHLQTRIDALPKPIQAIGWKAQVRLYKRFRRRTARGKHPNRRDAVLPRNLQTDPETSLTWTLKDEIVKRGKIYYAKLARGKTLFLAPRMIPCFHAVWGVPRSEEPRRLGRNARAILRVLRRNGR
jgi:hypothetical protein